MPIPISLDFRKLYREVHSPISKILLLQFQIIRLSTRMENDLCREFSPLDYEVVFLIIPKETSQIEGSSQA